MDKKAKVLIVAEKASIARSIAEAVAGKGKYIPRKGKAVMCPIMSWDGDFMGSQVQFNCTSVAGHVFNRDFPEQYQDWRKVDPIDLFDAPTIKNVANPQNGIVEHLDQESKDIDYLILWLDNDREGENICFEVLEVVQKNMKKGVIIKYLYIIQKPNQQVFRAKFSSTTNEDIQAAFKGLKNGPNKNESDAVDARQIIDLKVGVAFTRFQTKHLQRKFEAQGVISYGPCQTPTLAFCVERSTEINSFKPWNQVKCDCTVELPDKKTFQFQQLEQQQVQLQVVKKELESTKSLEVIKVEEKESVLPAPLPLNTVTMLKFASKYLQLSPNETMHLAEKLYLSGCLTYPRTETTKYAASFDFNGPLKALDQTKFGGMSQALQKSGIIQQKDGQDVGDHPPITVTNKPMKEFENQTEEKLYEFVARYFLASLAGPAKYLESNISFKGGKHPITYKGLKLVQPGFLDYLPFLKLEEKPIYQLKAGQQLPLKSAIVTEQQVQPPPHLNEEELITLMDKNHIGTDASLATHINTICERSYVTIDKTTRQLVPTKLGEAFIRGLKEIDADLCSPKLRSNMEKLLDQIALGKITMDKALVEILKSFKEKYQKFVKDILQLEKEFDTVFTSVDDAIKTAPLFSVCGRCKNQMRMLQGKIFCEKCKCMFGLPKKVNFQRTSQYCEIDGFEYIQQEGNKNDKLCPMCNQKAFKESQGKNNKK